MSKFSHDDIRAALKSIHDPELSHSLTALGMIGDIRIDKETVTIELKLPLPGSPGEPKLINDIKACVRGLGFTAVELVSRVMTDEERLELANRLHGRPAKGKPEKAGTASLRLPPVRDESGAFRETDEKRAAVVAAMATVNDPEINLPLTELGMLKAFAVGATGEVSIEILLTVPGCPLKDKIRGDVGAALEKLDWVTGVDIEFGVMTEAERQEVAQIVSARRSGEPEAWGRARTRRPAANTEHFAKRVIAVASGKGGVGKSTTTANLAFAMAGMGYSVGILDADIYGFSIPRMTGVKGRPRVTNDEKIEPVRRGSVQVMSMGYFIEEDAPVIWRGPLLHKAINQFLSDVLWEPMDFLFIDLPPGTGDVTITIATALPHAEMLLVTTPQPVATHVAGRVASLAERSKITLLGVVENMCYFEVGGRKERIFGEGGGAELAKRLKTPLLGSIPLITEIRERADSGTPVSDKPGSAIAVLYENIASRIVEIRSAAIAV